MSMSSPAPPSGSFMILSIIPKSFKSLAVAFISSAASFALVESLYKILANPSGDKIEYTAFSNMAILSPTAIANAPPLEPSPITIQIIGTSSFEISNKFLAIASPCPLSSAPIPGYAPGVSIKVIIGLLNFSACFINRNAFLYPSGFGIPKFLSIFSFAFFPFCSPITVTGIPSNVAIPPTIALSSPKFLSPCNSIKSSNSPWI